MLYDVIGVSLVLKVKICFYPLFIRRDEQYIRDGINVTITVMLSLILWRTIRYIQIKEAMSKKRSLPRGK